MTFFFIGTISLGIARHFSFVHLWHPYSVLQYFPVCHTWFQGSALIELQFIPPSFKVNFVPFLFSVHIPFALFVQSTPGAGRLQPCSLPRLSCPLWCLHSQPFRPLPPTPSSQPSTSTPSSCPLPPRSLFPPTMLWPWWTKTWMSWKGPSGKLPRRYGGAVRVVHQCFSAPAGPPGCLLMGGLLTEPVVTGCPHHCDPWRWHLWLAIHKRIHLPLPGGYPWSGGELDSLHWPLKVIPSAVVYVISNYYLMESWAAHTKWLRTANASDISFN